MSHVDDCEIFIIDKEVITYFFKNENYEGAELFFVYLTTHCKHNKAYMVPSIFEDISQKIKNETSNNQTNQSEVLSYLENWVKKADLLGEDRGEEKHDTLLLHRVLSALNPNDKVIIISENYTEHPTILSFSVEKLKSYLLQKPHFREYLRINYGVDDGASY